MIETIRALLTFLAGSAFVFLLNTRDERLRTLRDHITKTFEEARDEIKSGVSAGVAYWTCSVDKKRPDLEAQVALCESSVRSALADIRSICLEHELSGITTLRSLEGEFLDALTGGTFGSAPGAPDANRARLIIGIGSRLRSAVAKIRRQQLSAMQTRLSRFAGLLILFWVAIGVTYGAGIYAGLVAADAIDPSWRPHGSCGKAVTLKGGASDISISGGPKFSACLQKPAD